MRLCSPLGWQPSRFLTDRAEAERAYALAEQLGSVNAAARQRSGQPVTPTLDPVDVSRKILPLMGFG